MRSLQIVTVSLIAIMAANTAMADVILDDFSAIQLAGSTISVSAGGTTGVDRTVGTVSGVLGSGDLSLSDFGLFPGATETSEIIWDFTTSPGGDIDLSGEDSFFLRDLSTSGPGSLILDLDGSIATVSVGAIPVRTDFEIDLASLTGLNSVDTIRLAFDGDAFGTRITTSQVDFVTDTVTTAAVPEPSTWALLTLAGIGFGGYTWRKRRATKAE